MMKCLAPDCQMGGLGCDNMTVTLICLTPNGSTYEQLAARCAQNLPDHLSGAAGPVSSNGPSAGAGGGGEGGLA